MSLERHFLSNPFGEASQEDWQALRESIKQKGFIKGHEIVLFDGRILDGWHRYVVCQELGIDPLFKVFEGTADEARSFAWSENIARRQMTNRQKATAYLIANLDVTENARLSYEDVAQKAGCSVSIVRELANVVDKDKVMAKRIVRGQKTANQAVKETLGRPLPGDKTPLLKAGVMDNGGGAQLPKRAAIPFMLRNRSLIRDASTAQDYFNHTDTQMVNEAFRLYVQKWKGESESVQA